LFICGGAFGGLEKVIERRSGRKTMGFQAEAPAAQGSTGRRDIATLQQVQPTDLIHYGLIPEFVGRLPVISVLNDLDQAALVEILTQPKNALVRQYQRLFDFENVKLKFSDASLGMIATQAMERKVGARGLRMILEDLMLDLMYHLPSQRKVREFVVTDEMVKNHEINFSSAFLEKAG
jgi:ATP-dependent Clp protease ATP-binding subunit ClpX